MDGSAYDFKFFQHFMYTYIGLILIGINLVRNNIERVTVGLRCYFRLFHLHS